MNELVIRFGAEVTVILPHRDRNQGPQLAALPGVRLFEAAQPDDAALRAAGITEALSLALVNSDDVGNIHAALRAHDLNPDLRLVIRMFNTSLGSRIRTLFEDCAVLSDSAMAAPSFVAAALGEPEPTSIRLPGRTVYAIRRADVPPGKVICGLADTSGGTPRLLPADQDSADVVLALADANPEIAEDRGRGRAARMLRRLRFLLGSNLVRLVLIFTGLIVVGCVLMATTGTTGWGGAVYQTLLDAAGDAVPNPALHPFAKIIQLVVTLSGLALIPVATAVVVDGLVRARLADPAPDPALFGGHVVVVGLGNVGTRVVGQLHDLGVPVICVDTDENARGVSLARRLGVPVVFGEATREDTLRAVSLSNARALVLLTSSDVVNMEAALVGRSHREDLRVVLRLFDDDLADRLEHSVGIAISRSVSRLAAASFAAAMVERQVIGTMSIGRSALMLAEVPVVAGSPLVGQPVGVADVPDRARVIAVRHHGVGALDWKPRPDHLLEPQDRVTVVATRAGLGELLDSSIPTGNDEAAG